MKCMTANPLMGVPSTGWSASESGGIDWGEAVPQGESYRGRDADPSVRRVIQIAIAMSTRHRVVLESPVVGRRRADVTHPASLPPE